MKQFTLYIVAAILGMFNIQPASAQQTQDALYIYRNDGGFMGFFYNDIDHIEYSKIDTLGVEQSDYVVQEIYALDTLFRIPINAIDSIAFVTPETKYKSDVAHITSSDLWNYVTSQDGLTLHLASNTPNGILPKKGDKLVTVDQTEILPAGFVGQVTEVTNTGSDITINCEAVSLLDIFEQFTSKVRSEASSNENVRTRGDEEFKDHVKLPDISGSITLTDEYGFTKDWSIGTTASIGYTIKNEFDITAFLQVGLFTGLQFGSIVRGVHDIGLNYSVGGSLNYSHDITLLEGFVPSPLGPLLYLDYHAGLTFGGSGSIVLTGTAGLKLKSYSLIQFNSQRDGYQQIAFKLYDSDPSINIAKLSGIISLNAGGYGEVDITSLCKDLDKAGARMETGIKFDLSADFKWADAVAGGQQFVTSTSFYDALNRDGSVNFGTYWKGQLIAEVLKRKSTISLDQTFGKGWEGALVPNITKLNAKIDYPDTKSPQSVLTTKVSLKDREVLIASPVGVVVKDKKGNDVMDGWYNREYWKKTFSDYTVEMKGLEGGQTYKVYPKVKLFGFEMVASPFQEIKVDPVMNFYDDGNKFNTVKFDKEKNQMEFQLIRNFSQPDKTLRIKTRYQTDGGDHMWLDLTNTEWDNNGKNGIYKDYYKLTLEENEWDFTRHAEIDVILENKENEFEVTRTLYIEQKGIETIPINANMKFLGTWYYDGSLGSKKYYIEYYFGSSGTYKCNYDTPDKKYTDNGTFTVNSYEEGEDPLMTASVNIKYNRSDKTSNEYTTTLKLYQEKYTDKDGQQKMRDVLQIGNNRYYRK